MLKCIAKKAFGITTSVHRPEFRGGRFSEVGNVLQVNKFRKFERKYRDCIKRKGDKIGTQTCYCI